MVLADVSRRFWAVLAGGPVLLAVVTAFHLVLRSFLAPLVGRFFASVIALGVMLLVLLPHAREIARDPSVLYGYLGWGANLIGVAAAQYLKRFSSGGVP